ncbi:scarecrow-like protein 32 [Typha latifolia]|uniref:scarecrow-like protein 32 n=1 Tax=Typha latifolia TaxID=4733 RepID=UPI003C2AB3B7
MIQFTHSSAILLPPPPPSFHHNDLINPNHQLLHRASRPWTASAAKFHGSCFTAAGCMEELLVHCADAIEANDDTLAQQLLWVLNNLAPHDGDCNQRLTAAFLRALIVRASKIGSFDLLTPTFASSTSLHLHRFSAVDLASFIDLTPWHRFGYTAANAAIVDAVEGFQIVHIVDLSTTHCMQIPTLIDMLANRPEGPPFIRLTVATTTSTTSPPPMLDLSYQELGAKLVNFARSRNIVMEFTTIPSSPTDAFVSLIEQLRVQRLVSEGEALIVNCQMMLHYIPDETAGVITRSMFLKSVRSLEPNLVTVVDEDADFTADDVLVRLRSAFNYLWIAYDAIDAFLPRESERRRWYEAGIGWRIENVIAHEGLQRVERVESKGRWAQRMRGAGFRAVEFGEEAVGEVKTLVDEHARGWGVRKGDQEDLVLTWKGHHVVFASAWVPS